MRQLGGVSLANAGTLGASSSPQMTVTNQNPLGGTGRECTQCVGEGRAAGCEGGRGGEGAGPPSTPQDTGVTGQMPALGLNPGPLEETCCRRFLPSTGRDAAPPARPLGNKWAECGDNAQTHGISKLVL